MVKNFSDCLDPRVTLRQFKNIAAKGGDYGPFFDQGVLAVIHDIESQEFFRPFARWIGACCLREPVLNCLPDLILKVNRCLFESGLTIDEAIQYDRGVEFAQSNLALYREDRRVELATRLFGLMSAATMMASHNEIIARRIGKSHS